MIRTEKLVKKYGKGELETVVLKGIDLVIPSGDFVAIVGPSGAGKSTLLYQMSLLDEPSSGDIFFEGVSAAGLNQTQKTLLRLNNLGYVFQDYALLPELTAAENVALPMIMQGMLKGPALELAIKALARVNLDQKYRNLPSQLSGGQQQRVSIARAIANSPKILFADEPTANLDSENSRMVMDAFIKLHDEGQTIVMVTHEEEYARQTKRIISMRDGVVVDDFKP
jgi:putative ABC transport system ATP-binding protein